MTKQEKMKAALQDFVEFWNDPNMPMQELVKRAKEALKEAK